MPVLVDVNFLLALSLNRHPHHAIAARWLATISEDSQIHVCRLVQLGFLRLLNSPHAAKTDVQTVPQAWQVWNQLIQDSRFVFAGAEPVGLDNAFGRITADGGVSPGLWTDAYLAAFAIAGDLTFLSFYRGFKSFQGLRLHLLA